MNETTKKCMSPGCERRISTAHLMCVQHWKGVPGNTRRGVHERLNGWQDRGAAETFLSSFLEAQKNGNLSGVSACK